MRKGEIGMWDRLNAIHLLAKSLLHHAVPYLFFVTMYTRESLGSCLHYSQLPFHVALFRTREFKLGMIKHGSRLRSITRQQTLKCFLRTDLRRPCEYKNIRYLPIRLHSR